MAAADCGDESMKAVPMPAALVLLLVLVLLREMERNGDLAECSGIMQPEYTRYG